jgi:hypothetical protein
MNIMQLKVPQLHCINLFSGLLIVCSDSCISAKQINFAKAKVKVIRLRKSIATIFERVKLLVK